MTKEIILVKPRGFCAGVSRAIKILDLAVKKSKQPVYMRHQIVHNRRVVEEFMKKGVKFVEEVKEIPEGATVVFSAHGSPPSMYAEARKRKLTIIEAACPLVIKVHEEAKRFEKEGYFIVYVGHRGHAEGIGVLGELAKDGGVLVENIKEAKTCRVPKGRKIAVLTQTTLETGEVMEVIEELKKRFSDLRLPPGGDICYATRNRQGAVKELAKQAGVVLVVGSKESSNSNRLWEVAEEAGAQAYLIDRGEDIKKSWFKGNDKAGITAGASSPDWLVEEIVEKVKQMTGGKVRELEVILEKVEFSNLPKELELL